MEKNKKILKKVGNLDICNCYCVLNKKNPSQILEEKDYTMEEKIIILNKFKKFIKVSLKNHRINIYRKMKMLEEKEFLTCDPFFMEEKIYDDYNFLENQIVVMDFKMTVKNDLLYEVLNAMEQHQRDIVYMSFCEDMSDRQISEVLKMSRSKVQRIKQKLKHEIYDAMTGDTHDEN